MRLIEEPREVPSKRPTINGVNGNGIHAGNGDVSESESDIEEAEPVSATLVLRLINEPPSSDSSSNSLPKEDQSNTVNNERNRRTSYLQVQVQRTNSNNTQPNSRPRSTTPSSYKEDYGCYQNGKQHPYSRDSSISPSPSSLLGCSEIELHRPNGVNSVDFMHQVSEQTKIIQAGLKTLRGEVDNPDRVLDIGQEAIVLSGLNKSAGESLKNIKNLYDETKYLKLYLEKLEAKVHYDMTVRRKTSYKPPWYRRLIFSGLLITTGACVWRRISPASFDRTIIWLVVSGASACSAAFTFFAGENTPQTRVVTLQ